MKVLADTNIIIDSLQAREPFCEQSNQIIIDGANRKFDLLITSKSLADLHYVIHQDIHNEKETREIIKDLLEAIILLDTTAVECVDALDSNIKDYEDAIMEQTAFNNEIDVIVTRNKKDFKNSRVPAITPKEFIETFYEDGIYC